MGRTEWNDLPGGVRSAVAERIGAVSGAEPVVDGLTCSTAAILTTPGGKVFVKGVPGSDLGGVSAQSAEVAWNPLVRALGPKLLARVVAGGWDVLAFAAVEGRHADLSPGSPDVPLVADVLSRAHGLTAPASVPPLTDRFADVLDADGLALLTGDALLHTDTNPHNLLVGQGRAHLVDWAMAARGPAWVDVAYTAVRLMESGWPDSDALGWAGRFPSWRRAEPGAVAVFVDGTCRAWESRVGARDARHSNRRFRVLAEAGAHAG